MALKDIKLNTGAEIPALGFGTWQLRDGGEAESSVTAALNIGYRLIDTATIYGNEGSVGQAIKNSDIAREELFITTKLWPSDFENGRQAFDTSVHKLGLDYLDLYLTHWPSGPARKTAWETLAELHKEGRAKAVGVSNYMVEDLEELFSQSGLVPAVNQIELHPFVYRQQKPVLELCREHRIIVEAYSPLARGRHMQDKTIASIASTHGKSAAQVMLRWAVQHDSVPIPRSSNPQRIESNYQIDDFELTNADMSSLDNLS
jgi:diketogulonate reductase-like aldo/keto reductase